jgi:hypothetical protein
MEVVENGKKYRVSRASRGVSITDPEPRPSAKLKLRYLKYLSSGTTTATYLELDAFGIEGTVIGLEIIV